MNLSGNEIGEESVLELLMAIIDLLDKCPNLSNLTISDCKICLKYAPPGCEQDTVLNRLMDKISSILLLLTI
jgi:hypothetical protein